MDTPPNDPDLPLVRALQAGDESALNELMGKHEEPLFRLLHRFTGDPETARDLLQETFVRVYFQIHRFKPRAKFVTWLYAIATNLCRDHARSKRYRQSRVTDSLDCPEALQELPERGPDPAAAAETRERLGALEKAITQLPHDLRVALLLFSIEGYSQAECAALLGISAKAVEMRVYRARGILEKELQD